MTGRSPTFINSSPATTPAMPPPMIATSEPCADAGIEPMPASWVSQPSKSKGKSGPNAVREAGADTREKLLGRLGK